MTLNQISKALYATFLTNYYGYKLKKTSESKTKKELRLAYSNELLSKLDLNVHVTNPEMIPEEGQFLLVSNHRSVIDPLIIEVAVQNNSLFGHWISKKELYNSFFFGLFVKNAGTILLDRENSKMGSFMADIKKAVKQGDSIYIFPEGTRNKSGSDLSEFKDGSRIIAIKNRLDILPVYIKNNADSLLMQSLNNELEDGTIEVEFGEVISYKDKTMSLEEMYKKNFNIK